MDVSIKKGKFGEQVFILEIHLSVEQLYMQELLMIVEDMLKLLYFKDLINITLLSKDKYNHLK